jgi:diadenylate cyclase
METDFATNISNFLRTLEGLSWWRVAIELLVIGAVIFWIIRFLEGTRGARMLKGIGFVLIISYLLVTIIGQALQLTRLVFLYTTFLYSASFALAVVFQPELRRGLMRLGETQFFRGWSDKINEDIEQLVECATFLSHRKFGGLIAIEREVGLGGISENGTRINADLSADLLNTIFWPNSPLHDLGVVVSQGRIAYAAVQFPLAEAGELERELGSRHRAAVGMSQESDAVVIVVSEETGDISIAESGKLIRRLTPDALRGLLGHLLGGSAESTGPFGKRQIEPEGGFA